MNKKQSSVVLVAIITAALVVTSSMTTAPVSASITGNDTTITTLSSELELSAQPVWVEHTAITSVTPINERHSSVTYSGNGTLTLSNTTQTINTTSKGSALAELINIE
jgi:hypothetical protein